MYLVGWLFSLRCFFYFPRLRPALNWPLFPWVATGVFTPLPSGGRSLGADCPRSALGRVPYCLYGGLLCYMVKCYSGVVAFYTGFCRPMAGGSPCWNGASGRGNPYVPRSLHTPPATIFLAMGNATTPRSPTVVVAGVKDGPSIRGLGRRGASPRRRWGCQEGPIALQVPACGASLKSDGQEYPFGPLGFFFFSNGLLSSPQGEILKPVALILKLSRTVFLALASRAPFFGLLLIKRAAAFSLTRSA